MFFATYFDKKFDLCCYFETYWKLTDDAITKMILDNPGKVKRPVVGFNPHADNVKHAGGSPKHAEL